MGAVSRVTRREEDVRGLVARVHRQSEPSDPSADNHIWSSVTVDLSLAHNLFFYFFFLLMCVYTFVHAV